jgi:hypothetical protein
MANITTRSGKGAPLTNAEVDANFTNLNTEVGGKADAAHTHSYAGSSSVGGAANSANLLNGIAGTVDLNAQPAGQQGANGYGSGSGNNLPVVNSGSAQWWNTLNLGIGSRQTQLAFQAYGDGAGTAPQSDFWIRSRHDASWGAWAKVLTTKNYASVLASGEVQSVTSVIKQALYTRHIEGKGWDSYSTAASGLHLNYTSNQPVYIGSSAHLALHAGNYNSYALPLAGGTLTGKLTVANPFNNTVVDGIDLLGARNFTAADTGGTQLVAWSNNGTRGVHDFGALRFSALNGSSDGGAALFALHVGATASTGSLASRAIGISATSNSIQEIILRTNNVDHFKIAANGNIQLGAGLLGTTATVGFPFIPSCGGVPTGAVSLPYSGAIPLVTNNVNHRLFTRVADNWVSANFAQPTGGFGIYTHHVAYASITVPAGTDWVRICSFNGGNQPRYVRFLVHAGTHLTMLVEVATGAGGDIISLHVTMLGSFVYWDAYPLDWRLVGEGTNLPAHIDVRFSSNTGWATGQGLSITILENFANGSEKPTFPNTNIGAGAAGWGVRMGSNGWTYNEIWIRPGTYARIANSDMARTHGTVVAGAVIT